MVQLLSKSVLSAEKFIAEYGDDDRYELIDGELVDMEPTGPHEQVIGLIARKLNVEIDRLDWPYFIPHRCLIRLLGTATAFRPDLIVLDRPQLVHEPLWNQQPIITSDESIKLIVEVVSSNWQNNYARKVEDYALLGVLEYWIVDYLGLGGRDYIGKLKQPTVTVCRLVEDAYEKQLFRENDRLQSVLFPHLNLLAGSIFQAGQP